MRDATRHPSLRTRVIAGTTAFGVGAIGLSFAAPAAAHINEAPAPIAHYTMAGIDGATVPDSSGNGHDGTIVGTGASETTGTDGGAALSLPSGDGAAYVDIPSAALGDTDDLTVTARVQWDGGNDWAPVLSAGELSDGAAGHAFLVVNARTDAGVMRTAISGDGLAAETLIPGESALPSDEWVTVTVTLDASEQTLTTYLNGVEFTQATGVDVTAEQLRAGGSGSARIGMSPLVWDSPFVGAIDDVVIFDTALTAAQVGALPHVDMPHPDLHYRMDDVAGSTITDSSGNGHHGTLVGAASVVDGEGTSSALELSGGHVRIPAGILQETSDLTFSAHVKWNGGSAWQRIVDLGTDTSRYLFVTPSNGTELRGAITSNGPTNETIVGGGTRWR